jgi:hypothetical protein
VHKSGRKATAYNILLMQIPECLLSAKTQM